MVDKKREIAEWLIQFIEDREELTIDWEYALSEAAGLLALLDSPLLEDNTNGKFEGEL